MRRILVIVSALATLVVVAPGVQAQANLGLPLRWSNAGPIDGMICTWIVESSDPHTWHDNYLCSAEDFGFRWKSGGVQDGDGYCVKWSEPSDPHTWNDNYLCSNRYLGLRWSNAGPITGSTGTYCLRIWEPSDPYTWDDNYLCSGGPPPTQQQCEAAVREVQTVERPSQDAITLATYCNEVGRVGVTHPPFPGDPTISAGQKCGWETIGVYRENGWGWPLYQFAHFMKRCHKNGKTSGGYAYTNYTEYPWSAWKYVGLRTAWQDGCFNGCNFVRQFREAHFRACFPTPPPIPDLCASRTPWTRIIGRGDGTWGSDSGDPT